MSKRLYNNGLWTRAKFDAFIKNGLRRLSYKWPPRFEVKNAARVERGVYVCNGYKRKKHKVKSKEIQLDHISPVIDPATGHTTWDKYVNRLFTEATNFQILCTTCHKLKTKEERNDR